jgi:hypothetical protein
MAEGERAHEGVEWLKPNMVRAFIKGGAGEYRVYFERDLEGAVLLLIERDLGRFFVFEAPPEGVPRKRVKIEDTAVCIAVPEGGISCDGIALIIDASGECVRVRVRDSKRALAEFCE